MKSPTTSTPEDVCIGEIFLYMTVYCPNLEAISFCHWAEDNKISQCTVLDAQGAGNYV